MITRTFNSRGDTTDSLIARHPPGKKIVFVYDAGRSSNVMAQV